MKVDAKIAEEKVKSGLFSSKKMQMLRITLQLTETEIAIIKRAGIGHYVWMSVEMCPEDQRVLHETHWEYPIIRSDGTPSTGGCRAFDTLFEAQVCLQDTKQRLKQLKELMEQHLQAPTEDSFEL
jgi:hypothetical protein